MSDYDPSEVLQSKRARAKAEPSQLTIKPNPAPSASQSSASSYRNRPPKRKGRRITTLLSEAELRVINYIADMNGSSQRAVIETAVRQYAHQIDPTLLEKITAEVERDERP